jgi:hypothetical protein
MDVEAQDRTAMALCAIGGLCALSVLLGWSLQAEALAGFGSPYPTQPLTAVAFM